MARVSTVTIPQLPAQIDPVTGEDLIAGYDSANAKTVKVAQNQERFYANPNAFLYTYDNSTLNDDPGSGNFRLNNTSIPDATQGYFSIETNVFGEAVDVTPFLSNIFDIDIITIFNPNDVNQYLVASVTSRTNNVTYFTFGLDVEKTGPALNWTNGDVFQFTATYLSGGAGSGPLTIQDRITFNKNVTQKPVIVLDATPDTLENILDGVTDVSYRGTIDGGLTYTDLPDIVAVKTYADGLTPGTFYQLECSATVTNNIGFLIIKQT